MTEHLRVDTKGEQPRYFIGGREVTKSEYLVEATRISGNA